MPLLSDQEKNNIAECAEGGTPSTAQSQPLHSTAEQRDNKSKRDKHTQTEQPREESKREQ